MINFQELQENIVTCMAQQAEMADTISKMQDEIKTLATKKEMAAMEAKLQGTLDKQQRDIERLDVAMSAASQVVNDMPAIQRDLGTRMADLEQRLSAEVANQAQVLGGRVTAAEGELRNKASKADLTKMKTELEDCVRRDHVDKLQALVNKVRDEASDRIDGIAERTLNMRRELDSSMESIKTTSEAITSE